MKVCQIHFPFSMLWWRSGHDWRCLMVRGQTRKWWDIWKFPIFTSPWEILEFNQNPMSLLYLLNRLVNIFWEDIWYSAYLPLHISLGVFTTHPSTFFEWRIYSSCETFKMKGWEEKKIEKYFELSWVWKRFLVSMEGRCWWCCIWFPEISNIYHVIKSPTNQIIERQISTDR